MTHAEKSNLYYKVGAWHITGLTVDLGLNRRYPFGQLQSPRTCSQYVRTTVSVDNPMDPRELTVSTTSR